MPERTLQGVRPETLALDALIKACIARAGEGEGAQRGEALLFLGNSHTAFPTLVVRDPVLEPVDKLVWMTIRLQAHDTGGYTAFPRYDVIRQTANIASKSTVARAVAILRATRWLTLCARLRTDSGRFRGNVFALHDEPLPLPDALHLDSGYMPFLREAQTHVHARVRAVAKGVIATLDEDIQAGHDVCANAHPLVRRLQAWDALQSDAPQRFFAFSARAIRELRNHPCRQAGTDDQDQNSNPVAAAVRNSVHQNSNPDRGSSNKNKTTTTTPTTELKIGAVTGENEAPLVYPQRLGDNQRELAARYLATVAPEQRQPLLDELEGRFRSEEKGMRPLYDELSFLNRLCKAMRNGEFQANLGLKVQSERRAREQARVRAAARPVRPPAASAQALRDRIAAGQGPMAEIRKVLGLPDRAASKHETDAS